MTVPAFAKEAAEKAVSAFREQMAKPIQYPGRFSITHAVHPMDVARNPPEFFLREVILRSVRNLVFDLISGGGGVPSMPEISLREGAKGSIHDGLLILQVEARSTAQDDTDRRELTKALAGLLAHCDPSFPKVSEALKALKKHGHADELPPSMAGKAPPYG